MNVQNPMPRVLVVDDDEVCREVMQTLLQRFGCVVGLASDAGEAIEGARRTVYDLCILDMQLPDGSGLDLAKELRSRSLVPASCEFFAFSGRGVENSVASYFEAVLPKPIDIEQLRIHFSAWLERHSQKS